MTDLGIGKRVRSSSAIMDDFFSSQALRDEMSQGRIEDIPMDLIDDYPDHPFKVELNDSMIQLIDTIRVNGLADPILLRRIPETNRFQCISGHRRRFAYSYLGHTSIPAIVKEMDDNTAAIIMVNSNVYREEILPSEKAKAYKIRMDALRAARSSDIHGRTDEVLAAEYGESASQIQRYIRLNNLIPELLELVDLGRIKIKPAVEISYLSKKHQMFLYKYSEENEVYPSHPQAIRLKEYEKDKALDEKIIATILGEIKPNQKEKVVLRSESLKSYLPRTLLSNGEIEKYIVEALKYYQENH